MKNWPFFLLTAMAFSLVLPPGSTRAQSPSPAVRSVAEANNAFGLDIYRRLAEENRENLFFSPLSLTTALAMTYGGARGTTAQEMAQTLRFSLPQEELHPALLGLSQELMGSVQGQGQELSVANALWLKTGLRLLPDFLGLIEANYGKEINQLDFCQEEVSREAINSWVAERTRERIKELIPPGVLKCETRLVLTNAVYFLGEWIHKFDPQETSPDPFFSGGGKEIKTKFMNQTGSFAYGEGEGYQVLEMPYQGRRLVMTVLLPKAKDGLAGLESRLDGEWLKEAVSTLKPRQVKLSLPRFQVDARLDLAKHLVAAGMAEACSARADFSGMTGERNLSIDSVLQRAWLKVDEKGTEAAAATAVVVGLTAAVKPQEPVVFKADHPFLFLIRDRRTGAVLFMGRLTAPEPV